MAIQERRVIVGGDFNYIFDPNIDKFCHMRKPNKKKKQN